VLPPERTKNRREHGVPVTPLMRAIFDCRPRREGRDYIFGRRKDRPLTGWSVCKAGLDQRLAGAIKDPWTPHDLRRTCASRLGELGVPPHIVAATLNHVSAFRHGVHGVYDRADHSVAIANALTAWGEHLLNIVEGRPASKKVVPLRV
jgi:integrase